MPPWRSWEETIDDNTPDEMLHRIIQAADRTSDTNMVRAAAKATAELQRRQQNRTTDAQLIQLNAQKEMFENQSNAQRKMIEKLIQATHTLSKQQAHDAREQADKHIRISRIAACAAWGAAIAAFLTLAFNVFVRL